MLIWNPREHSEQENLVWCNLRALEWEAFPAFLSQPIAPVLLIFLPWYYVIGGTVVLSWVWGLFRHSFVSIILSEIGWLFVRLRWITVPAAAIYLFYTGHYILGIVSLLWIAIASFIGFTVPGGKTNVIQKMLMKALGYSDDLWEFLSENGTFSDSEIER